MNGAELIAAERQRQIDAEGWTPDHDDSHAMGQLAQAASCYLNARGPDADVSNMWPWDREWWKPKNRRSNLIRAGALYQAEIERLERRASDLRWRTDGVPNHLRVLLRGCAALLDELGREMTSD